MIDNWTIAAGDVRVISGVDIGVKLHRRPPGSPRTRHAPGMLAGMSIHHTRSFGTLALAMFCGLCETPHAAAQPQAHTSASAPAADRMAWWREARFGMFIHWGLYAIPAGEWNGKPVGGIGEWILNSAQITVADYEPLAAQFNPVDFNAEQWAKAAADAGMKYVVITSKHHDGFCLFDSKHTTWDVADATPFKRDILKELAPAVRAQGMQMCWYHSIMDWHHPDYLPRRAWDPRPELKPDFERFNAYLEAQVTELLTNYGPIGVMWFDGEWENTWTSPRGKRLYDLCRSLQPSVIVNNRVGKGRQGMQGMTAEGDHPGDFGTPEQEIPSTGIPGVDWESCMTMNDTWGYKKDDLNWKSTTTLVRNLIDCASKGGNYLLNVGPDARGRIPDASLERLREIGQWMKVNGSSIYGTQAGPFRKLPFGRATRKANTLYIHVFDWPQDGSLRLPGLTTPITGASLLAAPGRSVEWASDPDGATLRVGQMPADPHASVIEVTLSAAPNVIETGIRPNASGAFDLDAQDAETTGSARYEPEHDKRAIGYWMNTKDRVRWSIKVAQPGEFEVFVTYACDPKIGGGTFRVSAADAAIEGRATPTASWTDFRRELVGTIRLPAGASVPLDVTAISIPNGALMNLRRVELVPQK